MCLQCCINPVRHISCSLVLLSNPLEQTEANILKQVTVSNSISLMLSFIDSLCTQMATKTGRAWLGMLLVYMPPYSMRGIVFNATVSFTQTVTIPQWLRPHSHWPVMYVSSLLLCIRCHFLNPHTPVLGEAALPIPSRQQGPHQSEDSIQSTLLQSRGGEFAKRLYKFMYY